MAEKKSGTGIFGTAGISLFVWVMRKSQKYFSGFGQLLFVVALKHDF
jgi:hypothetical protein